MSIWFNINLANIPLFLYWKYTLTLRFSMGHFSSLIWQTVYLYCFFLYDCISLSFWYNVMCNVKIQIHTFVWNIHQVFIYFDFWWVIYSHNQTLCLHCKLCSLRTNALEKSKSTKLIELIFYFQILITYLSYLFRKAAKIKKNENMYTVDIYSYELRKRVLVYV